MLALAHVTGGGFPDNLPRVLPDDLAVALDLAAFAPPPVFCWLAAAGGVERSGNAAHVQLRLRHGRVRRGRAGATRRSRALGANGLAPKPIGGSSRARARAVVMRGRLKL